MQAFTQTFNEIIKRDRNFGSLLLKIKQAYDEYIRKTVMGPLASPPPSAGKPSYEVLENQINEAGLEIIA